MTETGTLYLVPTPIGNLADITYRAVTVLGSVDLIACEDTRTSSVLLNEYGIDTPRTSYHQHNEHTKTSSLVEKLVSGKSIALITDAGTPGVSDPGFFLVRASIEAGVRVEALPGPTAIIPALVASGLPSDRFLFEGFLPPKKGRQTRIKALVDETKTVVLYESPHKLPKLLQQFREILGEDRQLVVCREISKKFESYHRGSVAELIQWIAGLEKVRGEIVVVLAGCEYMPRPNPSD